MGGAGGQRGPGRSAAPDPAEARPMPAEANGPDGPHAPHGPDDLDAPAGLAGSFSAWPLPIAIELSETDQAARAEAAERGLRARPGIAALLGGGACVLCAAAGDLRSFVASRLRGEGPRADLGAVTDRVLACEAGSGFEADLACDALLAVFDPPARERAAESRRVWLVSLDPADRTPACAVVEAGGSLEGRDPATLIGPFARRTHAEAFAKGLDDRFELCREPATLARFPDAEACVYKQMGACPAPCDGSESMEAYRGRVRAALDATRGGFAGEAERVLSQIGEASAAHDFENAARLKATLDGVSGLRKACERGVTTIDRFGVLIVAPSGRGGWARLMLHARGRTRVLGDVRRDAAGEAWGVVRETLDREPDGGWRATAGGLDAAGLVLAHMRSSRKSRAAFLPMDPGGSVAPEGLEAAVRRACGPTRRGGNDDSAGTGHGDGSGAGPGGSAAGGGEQSDGERA